LDCFVRAERIKMRVCPIWASARRNSSGSLAMLVVIRCASSRVSKCATDRRDASPPLSRSSRSCSVRVRRPRLTTRNDVAIDNGGGSRFSVRPTELAAIRPFSDRDSFEIGGGYLPPRRTIEMHLAPQHMILNPLRCKSRKVSTPSRCGQVLARKLEQKVVR